MSRLLLIDDDDNFRKMLRIALADRGYEVTEACDRKEGLARHGARPADLVITDLSMPGKEGLDTIRELRKLQPGLEIVAMSGGGRMSAKDYLPLARQLGAARVFAKPFANDALVAAIAELLAGHRSRKKQSKREGCGERGGTIGESDRGKICCENRTVGMNHGQ